MQHVTDPRVEPSTPRAPPRALVGAAVVDLSVAGMGCPSCGNRIRNALLAHPGVVEAEIDVPAGLARVWYDDARVGVRELVGVVSVLGEASQHRYLAVPMARDLRRPS